jgi:MscS family membrane protein
MGRNMGKSPREILKHQIQHHRQHFEDAVDQMNKGFRSMNRSIIFFGILFVIILGIVLAHFRGIFDLPPFFVTLVTKISVILGAYLIAAVVARLTVNRVIGIFEKSAEVEQKILISKIYVAIIYLVATTISLWEIGVTLDNITILIGLLATAVALAIRDYIASYLAWFMLLTKRPFRIGDYIKIGNDEGKVQHIGTFYVLIDDTPERSEDYVRIPNITFLSQPVRNYGRGEITSTLRMPISAVPRDFDSRISHAEKEIHDKLGRKAELLLDVDNEKWYVRVEYTTPFSVRLKTRDAILRIMAKTLLSE